MAVRLWGVKLGTLMADGRDISDGQPASLGGLYRERYGDMVRLALLLTGSNAVAEELVQDAFVRLHHRWATLDEPRAYLRTAVVNGCRSHHRRRFLERSRGPAPPPASVTAEVDELWDAIAALPYRQRAVIVMKFYADMAEADIAAALGCRAGTVKSLTSRALAHLRKVIEP